VKRVFEFEHPTITVGIHAKEGAEIKNDPPPVSKDFLFKLIGSKGKDKGTKNARGITVLDVANWMEFGTATVPARSFIRAWFDENKERANRTLVALLWSVIDGKLTKAQMLAVLGLRFVAQIQLRISDGIPPPLKQATIDRKGSSVPLISTGQLRSSITHRVYEGGTR
jgi:hypothetical protein